MNIFYLSHNTSECAKYHNDKHVVKMILEYSQLLSTAHRVLDGYETTHLTDTLRWQKVWKLPNQLDSVLYKATHMNHPSAIWVRKSSKNYLWLHSMLVDLCWEYTFRYNKTHKCQSSGLVAALSNLPKSINLGNFTQPTPAMPDEFIVPNDSISSYRRYYNASKQHLANWKNRQVPTWYNKSED